VSSFIADPVTKPTPEDLEPEELTEDELKAADKGSPWTPEPEPYQDFWELEDARSNAPVLPKLKASQFTEFALRMPRADGMGYENFTFKGRRHMIRPYNTPARRVLLFCGRQVEKSTMIGNIMLTYSCIVTAYKTLYVSPSATQTKVFSSDRIKEPIETSPVLRAFTTSMLSQNIFEKQFVNRAKITLRYAFLNADRTRGIPAWLLTLDELQDIISDNIPVIEQCTSHAPEMWKRFIYAGTPKGMDNPIEFYRAGSAKGRPMSTQGEWMVPCDHCGSKTTGRHWNILGERNIGRKFLCCERCGGQIFPSHEEARWANQVQDGIFESYRIPQLMVPWRSWDEILLDYERYPRDKFYNEVLGMSFDSGLRPITSGQLRDACNPGITMHPTVLEQIRKSSDGSNIFAGIDWGSGENSYTVLTLGRYVEMKFQIFFIHRFTGADTDPEIQLEKIRKIIHAFNVRIIACDYGGGFNNNAYLTRRFGTNRVFKYQYVARCKKKAEFDSRLARFKVHRTEVMSDIFSAIKRKLIQLPRWEEFQDPFGQDILNIFTEYNESLHQIQYQHRPDRPDDSYHSILYCFLGSQIIHPRPDIIVPRKEDPRNGPMLSTWNNHIDQG
jgi:hypothetical protein